MTSVVGPRSSIDVEERREPSKRVRRRRRDVVASSDVGDVFDDDVVSPADSVVRLIVVDERFHPCVSSREDLFLLDFVTGSGLTPHSSVR